MIHDEICSFKLSKLAKEKGFGEMASCYQGYRKDGTLFYFSNMPDGKERVMQTDCLAPTQSLLQRWLREEKNLYISIIAHAKLKRVYYEWEVRYISALGNMNKASSVMSIETYRYNTYELALEDALKYALENLI